jgi:hypothetical protein
MILINTMMMARDEQQMYVGAQGVKRNHPQQPQDHENDGNGHKHIYLRDKKALRKNPVRRAKRKTCALNRPNAQVFRFASR